MNVPPAAPAIAPRPADEPNRPFWSVMIPTYNAPAPYLEATLRCILAQDPGPAEMEIVVVDDASPRGAPEEIVQRIGQGRIALHCEPANLGLARIWNRCIERARGRWIHLLHQDDLVRPGFYAALRQASAHAGVGAAFCRYTTMDAQGREREPSPLHRSSPGILADWPEQLAVLCRIQCPAIVVRRAVYEELGGFLPELRYAIDWEMWQRIASRHAFWFEPSVLASYRLHGNSASSSLILRTLDALDHRRVIEIAMAYHPPARAAALARSARRNYARYGLAVARDLFLAGQNHAAWRQVAAALDLSRDWPVLPKALLLLFLRWRLAVFPPRLRSPS